MPDHAAADAGDRLRDRFLGWQCRIRQIAMRRDGGRPSDGMCPKATMADGTVVAERLTVLLVPEKPAESTAFFRHQVRRTRDRREVHEEGLAYLQATHFQNAKGFSDQLTALFGAGGKQAATLMSAGGCSLAFAQFNQSFVLPCSVVRLAPDDAVYQATLWHNRLFNPDLPDGVDILGFRPDWSQAKADPPAA